jgi:hypothetical protein
LCGEAVPYTSAVFVLIGNGDMTEAERALHGVGIVRISSCLLNYYDSLGFKDSSPEA